MSDDEAAGEADMSLYRKCLRKTVRHKLEAIGYNETEFFVRITKRKRAELELQEFMKKLEATCKIIPAQGNEEGKDQDTTMHETK